MVAPAEQPTMIPQQTPTAMDMCHENINLLTMPDRSSAGHTLPGCGKSTSELRLIAQAGGSLIVDLSKHSYSASELIAIASSLSHGASLTIRMRQDGSELSATQCAQIARAKPGQVRFWF